MSIDIMGRLRWRDLDADVAQLDEERFPGSGKNLFWTLYMMADMAGEDGFCWPAVETIAQLARLSPRAVQMSLRQAEALGFISKRERRDSSSQYIFHLDRLPHVARPLRAKERGPLEFFAERQDDLFGTGAGDSPVGKMTGAGDSLTGAGDSLTGAGDSPRTINETPENPHLSDDEQISIMIEQSWAVLVDQHQIAGFRKLDEDRRGNIVRRTDEWAKGKDLDAKGAVWRHAFEVISSSKLLMGKSTDWKATFDWVLKKANFRKIMENQYGQGRDRIGAAGTGDRSAVEAGLSALDLMRSNRGEPGPEHPPAG